MLSPGAIPSTKSELLLAIDDLHRRLIQVRRITENLRKHEGEEPGGTTSR